METKEETENNLIDWSNERTWIQFWEVEENYKDSQIDKAFIEQQNDPLIKIKQLMEDKEI